LTDVALAGLSIAEPPERWAALGFHVRDGQIQAQSVTLTLGIAPPGGGIVGWKLAGTGGEGDVGGLGTRWLEPGSGDRHRRPSGRAFGAGRVHRP
jgi:hypothetical protein